MYRVFVREDANFERDVKGNAAENDVFLTDEGREKKKGKTGEFKINKAWL